VTVGHTTDHFENTALTTMKTPWWWHLWSAETCSRRFCASVVCLYSSACEVGFMSWFVH